ncbi:MAG: hypothetical protein LBD96_11010, partial [Treponema sp.]|nr:hypothetical protein [Treponema sp.]
VGQGSYWLNLEERSLQGSTQSGIDLGSHTYITLSGSVAVTLNGIPVTSGNDYSINVHAYPNENYSGNQLDNAKVDPTGTWTMLVEASSPAQTYYFEVSVYDYAAENLVRKGTGVSRQGSTSPITGINLGTLAFNN